jgi:signal recognition particle receptor subunit beta
MVVFNYSGREINAKIVYYGPGLSGKTTNLEYIYNQTAAHLRGKMVSMKTKVDRTLFFDFLPIEGGEIAGFNVRFLLYTVPGQVYYNATRKLVLKGADAIVFVADSQAEEATANRESLKNLSENLSEHGKDLNDIPMVIQYNKRDLPSALPIDKLEAELNPRKVPSFESVATDGRGVFETLAATTRMVMKDLREQLIQDQGEGSVSDGREISFGCLPEPHEAQGVPGQVAQDSSTIKDKVSDVPSPGEEPSPAPAAAGGSCPSTEQCTASQTLDESGPSEPSPHDRLQVESAYNLEAPDTRGARAPGERRLTIPIRLTEKGKPGHVIVNLAVDVEIVVDGEDKTV